tara:strand:+ start:417 stop:710 length:294 start_codon:yes stop_codon:yes gene_type:complete
LPIQGEGRVDPPFVEEEDNISSSHYSYLNLGVGILSIYSPSSPHIPRIGSRCILLYTYMRVEEKKLVKLNRKAQECVSREKAKKILKKEEKVRKKMA